TPAWLHPAAVPETLLRQGNESLKTYTGAETERPRRAVLADEPRRGAGERKRDRDVGRVERIPHPELAERPLAAQTNSNVRQRISILPGGVRFVVLVVAVADGFGPREQADLAAQRTRVLNTEVRRVGRRVRQLLPGDIDAAGEAAVLVPRVNESD